MNNADRIKPWPDDPRYWQYKDKPVVLMGGSREDNLFQKEYLQEDLDTLASIGGNYIRNTMSDRDEGDVYPFAQQSDDKYDLNQWNNEYWDRFESMLKLADERDIIIQIEVWDRFDMSDSKGMGNWQRHPYNPANNINYTYEETGFTKEYPDHPGADKHPFYHSVPGMVKYDHKYDTFRLFQEKYLDKLLSLSIPFGNVLYCMSNETSTEPAWGKYWMAFIRERAKKAGVDVSVTDMFDDAWKPEESNSLRMVLDDPETYDFIEISQVNSRNFGIDHWNRALWIRENAKDHPRPRNNTKIYSDGQTSFGSGTPQDGIERFWRHLLTNAASVRFHRPTAGIGLNEISRACIKAGRQAEKLINFRDLEPRMDLLKTDGDNIAYLAADAGTNYVLFFCKGGSAGLDLAGTDGELSLQWIDISSGETGEKTSLKGNSTVTVQAPGPGPWAAVIK